MASITADEEMAPSRSALTIKASVTTYLLRNLFTYMPYLERLDRHGQ